MCDLKKIIDTAGGVSVVAKALGVSVQVVCNWIARGQVPAAKVLDFEKATAASRYDLRPDIFGPAPRKRAA